MRHYWLPPNADVFHSSARAVCAKGWLGAHRVEVPSLGLRGRDDSIEDTVAFGVGQHAVGEIGELIQRITDCPGGATLRAASLPPFYLSQVIQTIRLKLYRIQS
jgi:hypothetical protein